MTFANSTLLGRAAKLEQRLYGEYSRIEQQTVVREHSTRTTYRSPVNFKESMGKPRHRWFPYKEGFSPSFVREFVSNAKPTGSGVILDPFSGSGTTAIVAGEMGRSAIGMDVSPLTVFVSEAKATQLDASQMKTLNWYIERFRTENFDQIASPPLNKTIEKYFEPSVYDALCASRLFIN